MVKDFDHFTLMYGRSQVTAKSRKSHDIRAPYLPAGSSASDFGLLGRSQYVCLIFGCSMQIFGHQNNFLQATKKATCR